MQTAVQQKWEYRIESAPSIETLQRELTQAGIDGWELVTVLGGAEKAESGPVKTLRNRRTADLQAIFKRPQS